VLSYDGRNTSLESMTLSGGTAWDVRGAAHAHAERHGLRRAEVGHEIVFTAPTDDLAPLRFRIDDVT
jgi:hypothetical protein